MWPSGFGGSASTACFAHHLLTSPAGCCGSCCLSCSQDGLAQQFLTNLAKLKASKDCVLGLAATLSLWYLAAEDANPCYLASVAAAVLVDQLLQVGDGAGAVSAMPCSLLPELMHAGCCWFHSMH